MQASAGITVKQLEEIRSRHGKEALSRIYLIDITVFKEHLGDKWERLAEKIHAIAQQSIDRHMTEADMAMPYGDTSFLLVFTRLNQLESQLKCLLIAHEVGRRLAGNEAATEMVKVRTVSIDDEAQIVREEELDVKDVADDLRHEMGVTATTKILQKIPPLITAELDHWEQTQFIYRPLLSLRGMVVSTFICLPILRRGKEGFHSGYQVLPDPANLHQVADLDTLVLAKAISDLAEMAATGAKALLCLPVHVDTLSTLRHRSAYVEICRKYLSSFSGKIIFELVGLPEGIPQSRLIDLVSTLRPHSRAVIARFPLDKKNFSFFRMAGLHAVGIDIYYSTDKERVLMHKMEEFVERANKATLSTYVHGLHTMSLTTFAITCGFDYIDGYSLSSVVEIPSKPIKYDLQQFYDSMHIGK